MVEELKQRIKAKSAKLRKYEERNNKFMQNRLFQTNKKGLFEKMEGIERKNDERPDAEESITFWSSICSKSVQHNDKVVWLMEVDNQFTGVEKQENIQIRKGMVQALLWKTPDHVHGYWLKNSSNLHELITMQLDEILRTGETKGRMTKGHTCLIPKDESKGKEVSNIRPITCLPLMWKILTGIISEEVYNHFERESLFPDEQKGCRRNSRGRKDKLMIDKR